MILISALLSGVLVFIIDLLFKLKERSFVSCIKSFLSNITLSVFLSTVILGFFAKKPIVEFFPEKTNDLLLYFVLSFAVTVAIKLLMQLLQKVLVIEHIKERSPGKIKKLKAVSFVLAVLGMTLFAASSWVYNNYGGITFDQVIINVLSPTTDTELSLIISIIEDGILKVVVVAIFAGWIIFPKVNISIKSSGKSLLKQMAKSVVALVCAVALLIFGASYGVTRLKLYDVTRDFVQKSTYIEDNYVTPETASITFPKEKRNLIFVYLESMENSYLSKELGGYMETNLMPELTELAKEGVVFSDRPEGQFGGPTLASGSQWSAAGIVNMNAGLPLKIPSDFRKDFGTNGYFMNGACTIGDVLNDAGYNQTVMFGANAFFAGLDVFFKQHGDFKIFDLRYARKTGLIPKDYKVWWGFEDAKLYEFAKDEITRLYKEGKPFNFVMETADTHFPDGYLEPGTPTPYASQYANVIAHSTKETVKFVRWIQEQPFYENTTIVLIGDHPSMDKNFFRGFDADYKRTTFNLILNPAGDLNKLEMSRRHNRLWASFDMYPTTLASIGCTIEGNRLGLGTNLFSDEKTLFERDGVEKVNKQLLQSSDFYTEVIMATE